MVNAWKPELKSSLEPLGTTQARPVEMHNAAGGLDWRFILVGASRHESPKADELGGGCLYAHLHDLKALVKNCRIKR